MTDPRSTGATRLTPTGADDESAHASDRPAAGRPLLFLPFLLIFIAGLWLMGYGYDEGSALLFSAGLLASGVAFAVPLHLGRD